MLKTYGTFAICIYCANKNETYALYAIEYGNEKITKVAGLYVCHLYGNIYIYMSCPSLIGKIDTL